jgi:hypothetical protein
MILSHVPRPLDMRKTCAGGRIGHLLFATHPHHASVREWFYASTVSEDSHHSGNGLPRITLPRLSEKGFEHRSEREFGRYTEHEKSLWVACRTTLQDPPTLFGQFLDGVLRTSAYGDSRKSV